MSLERLLAKSATRRYLEVEIPEIGETVRIRSLTERERSAWESSMLTKDGKLVSPAQLANTKRRLVALSLCNEAGERIVSDDQVEVLGDLDAAAFARIFDAASELCGLEKRDIEALEKN